MGQVANPGPNGVPWPQVYVGDGGYTAINPNDPNEQFAESDGNDGTPFGLAVTSNAWASNSNYVPLLPPRGANFVAPMTIAPNNNAGQQDSPTVYYGSGNLYRTSAITTVTAATTLGGINTPPTNTISVSSTATFPAAGTLTVATSGAPRPFNTPERPPTRSQAAR